MADPTPPDWRALCARMADELDHYRQLLMDDRRATHALALEARAAQWDADQEMDASSNWLVLNGYGEAASRLRAAHRPKPPSLKEQALRELAYAYNRDKIDDITYDTLRRTLEALPND
jgi:hypothetical protein